MAANTRGESEEVAQMSKRCENSLKLKNDEPSRVSDHRCLLSLALLSQEYICPLLSMESLFRRLTQI